MTLCTHFFQLRELKSLPNSSRLINHRCEWTFTANDLFAELHLLYQVDHGADQ